MPRTAVTDVLTESPVEAPTMPTVTTSAHLVGQMELKDVTTHVTALVEAEMIRTALEQTGQNQSRAARLLGISIRTLLYKMTDYKIRGRNG